MMHYLQIVHKLVEITISICIGGLEICGHECVNFLLPHLLLHLQIFRCSKSTKFIVNCLKKYCRDSFLYANVRSKMKIKFFIDSMALRNLRKIHFYDASFLNQQHWKQQEIFAHSHLVLQSESMFLGICPLKLYYQ